MQQERQQAEAQRIEQLERMLESSCDGFWEWELPDGAFHATPRWFELHSCRPGEAGATMADLPRLVHPKDRRRVRRRIEALRAGSVPEEWAGLCYRCQRADRSVVHLLTTCRVSLRDRDGGPLRLTGTVRDITRHKRAEQELRRNQSRLESLLEISQRPFDSVKELLDHALGEAIQLTSSRIGYIYHYYEERRQFVLNSWSREAMAACTVDETQIVHELERTGLWGEAVRQKKPILVNDYATANPWKRGLPPGHVPLKRFLTVPVLSGERVVAVVGVGNKAEPYDQTDVLQLSLLMESVWKIVERHQAEEALRESKERLSRAQEFAHLGSCETDLLTGETVWSDELFAICGYEPQAFRPTAEQLEELLHPEDRGMVAEARRRALEEGRPYLLEIRLRRSESEVRHVQCWVGVVRDDASRPVRLVNLFLDITDRKRLEAQFLQAQKMESIGRLAGGVAHDFNNLLTVISGNAELALDGLKHGQPLREELTEICHAAGRAAELTGRLLAFSRRQIAEPKVLDLNALLAGQERMLRRLIGEHIELVTRLEAGLKSVKMDPGQLEQVLTNLVVNARDAMPGGGRLLLETASVRFEEGYRARHLEAQPGEYVLLAVSDTGCGMSEEVKRHLFEPFFTTKPPGAGTGLGLSTCYGIVKQNGGLIEVYSEPGRGTTVKVYLPAAVPALSPAAPAPAAALPGGGETVLLVEDEPSIRQLSGRILISCGYRVYTAEDGREALKIADRLPVPPDLLITDVVLPGWSGREIAARLQVRYPTLRVMYVSGYTENAIVHHGVLDPGVAFLRKPFSPAALARKVRQALGRPPD